MRRTGIELCVGLVLACGLAASGCGGNGAIAQDGSSAADTAPGATPGTDAGSDGPGEQSGVTASATTATPASVAVGGSIAIQTTITSVQALPGVEVTVFFLDAAGNYFTDGEYDAPIDLPAGAPTQVTWSYTVAADIPAGSYQVAVKVRSSDFATTYLDQSGLAPFTVTTSSTTPPGNGALVFPQIGVQAILGGQHFPTANLKQLAQYQWILMGGNFPGWPAVNAANGGYGTRDEVVQALKGQTHTGKNAVTPFILQYENIFEMSPSAPWFSEWMDAIAANNWYVYQSGTSGAKAEDVWSASYIIADPAHVAGKDSATGLYPIQLAAKLLYERYYLGTGSGGAAMASTHLDGYYIDNLCQRDLAASTADWLRNGTAPSQTDPTATAAVTLGKADYPAAIAALDPSIVITGNTEFGYDMAPASSGGLGMASSNLSGKLAQGMQQFMWGTAGGYNNVLDFGGFAGFMTWYQTIDAHLAPGGRAQLTGGVLATDYQLVRYTLCATLMRNGIAIYATPASGTSGDVSDVVDPGDTSTYPVFDEFWGGSLETAGYLGAASSTAQGAIQTAAWQNGVWRRDFANGIALVNPAGNGARTVQLETAFKKLTGTQAPSINNGQTVTSVTLQDGDGLILLRN